jgi:uncharacterized Tic20 family protein
MSNQSYWQSNFQREGQPPSSSYEPREDERTLAVLTHALGIIFWIIPPLIVYLWKKDESPWVAEHAKEAFNFQLTLGIMAFVMFISLIGIIFLWIPGIIDVVFSIVAALRANDKKMYRYPLTLRLLK